MTRLSALLLVTAVVALVSGIRPPDPDLTGEPFPIPFDPTLLASDQSPNIQQSLVQLRQIEIPTPR